MEQTFEAITSASTAAIHYLKHMGHVTHHRNKLIRLFESTIANASNASNADQHDNRWSRGSRGIATIALTRTLALAKSMRASTRALGRYDRACVYRYIRMVEKACVEGLQLKLPGVASEKPGGERVSDGEALEGDMHRGM